MRNKPINVVCIEPGIVKTNMHPTLSDPVYGNIDEWDNSVYTPLMPTDIVNTIDWALNQPPWINLNLIKLNTNSMLVK
jgi:hypothetical protein